MTIAVYRDGVLAADSMCDDGSLVKSMNDKKIFVAPSKVAMISCAGYASFIQRFVDWWMPLNDYDRDPLLCASRSPAELRGGELSDGFRALEVFRDGRVFLWDEGMAPYRQEQKWHAIGCGIDMAWGALAMGATAEQAVSVCCEHGVHTGGEIQIARLSELSETKSEAA